LVADFYWPMFAPSMMYHLGQVLAVIDLMAEEALGEIIAGVRFSDLLCRRALVQTSGGA
jgi:hypothetical protein